MVMNNLQWLMKWYQCNPVCKSSMARIKIGTLDNPGWFVNISLAGLDLTSQPFSSVYWLLKGYFYT